MATSIQDTPAGRLLISILNNEQFAYVIGRRTDALTTLIIRVVAEHIFVLSEG